MIQKMKYENPLDVLFDVEGSVEVNDTELVEVTEGELAAMQAPQAEEKDEEDAAIDAKIDEVYDSAITTFQNQMAYTEIIEPRYAARNAEVAASYLNIALNAAATRARVKGDRKRTATFVPFNNGTNPGRGVVSTREEIMRLLAVDGEVKEVK